MASNLVKMAEDRLNDLLADPPLSLQQVIMVGTGTIFVVYAVARLMRKKYKLAPGPTQLPVIGNAIGLSLSKLPAQENIYQMSKKYGPVVRLSILGKEFVVLNSIEAVREAFVTKQDYFANRPVTWSGDVFSNGGKDILMSQPGPVWKYMRQIAHQAMRRFASAERLETVMMEVCDRAGELIMKTEGPQNISPINRFIVYNMIATVCFGKEFTVDDPEFVSLCSFMDDANDVIGSGVPADFMPWLAYVPFFWPQMKRMKSLMQNFNDFLDKQLKEHRENSDQDQMQDLTDYILAQQMEAEIKESSKKGLLSEEHIVNIIADVFGAALDTTVTTIQWYIAYMIKYPEIQKKLHSTIDEVYEPGDSLLGMRHRLPFVEASLNEIMRIETAAPMGMPVTTGADTSVGGYDIPADTMVMPNIWAMHHSEDYWEEPNQFRPERFLAEDGSLRQKIQTFMPFSLGRRQCIGEVIARHSLFMIIVLLFSRFEFKPACALEDFHVESTGITLGNTPKDFQVIIVEREKGKQ